MAENPLRPPSEIDYVKKMKEQESLDIDPEFKEMLHHLSNSYYGKTNTNSNSDNIGRNNREDNW